MAECMECEQPLTDRGLRQGDIVAAHPNGPHWANPWTRFGVLMSADCDIAQEKTGPSIAYLPVAGLPTYLEDVWLRDKATQLGQDCEKQIERHLGKFQSAGITLRHVLNWSEDKLREEVGKAAKVPTSLPEADIVQLRTVHVALSALQHSKDLGALQPKLTQFFEQSAILKTVNGDEAEFRKRAIKEALSSIVDTKRTDIWVICDLIGLDPEMRQVESSGFVIDLRRLSSIPSNSIVTERRLWLERPESYLRICRLRGIYKSDLVQKFANMFARVGLEDRRVEEHKYMCQQLAERLCG